MKIKWRFGSPLLDLLVARYAPSDTYTVWKRGERLRIDGTLLGVDVGGAQSSAPRQILAVGADATAAAPPQPDQPHGAALRHLRLVQEGGQRRAASTAPKPRASVTLTARPQHASAVAAGAAAVTTDCAITVEPPTAADSRFHDRFMRGVFTRDEMKGEGATFAGTELEGQPLRERVDGVPTAVFEASTRSDRFRPTRRTGTSCAAATTSTPPRTRARRRAPLWSSRSCWSCPSRRETPSRPPGSPKSPTTRRRRARGCARACGSRRRRRASR